MLYDKAISTLMHDINCKTAPINVIKLFTNIASIHSYNTRSAKAGNFYEKFSRLHQQSQSFSRIGSKTWNKLPQYLRIKRFSFKRDFYVDFKSQHQKSITDDRPHMRDVYLA